MKGMIQSMSGVLTVELTSPNPAESIQQILSKQIEISNLDFLSELTVTFQIQRKDFKRLRQFAEKHGLALKLLNRQGVYWKLRSLLRRPLFVSGMICLLLLFWVLPGRILIVEVEGNDTVPSRMILEAAAESGIGFFSSAREVRSEKMKNTLLAKLPQLGWAGVNTYGSRAVITVRERNEEPQSEAKKGVSSIVAERDAIILSCTVTKGTGLVSPGQAVQAGQTLISGYTDCGISIEATRAEGEICGITKRNLTVVTPMNESLRAKNGEADTKYALLLGKKRINLYKGSGISPVSCVKMYSEYVLTLPGGFRLPVTLITETVTEYEAVQTERNLQTVEQELSRFADRYLRSIMIAGHITDRAEYFEASDVFRFVGSYACREQIGRDKSEQIGVYNGKTD